MTKTTLDLAKAKKVAKAPSVDRILEEDEQLIDNTQTLQAVSVDDGDSVSSVLTDEEGDGENPDLASSGEDTDQMMSRALDTIQKQACESKIVVPPDSLSAQKENLEPPVLPPSGVSTSKEISDLVSDSGESSADTSLQPLKPVSIRRKLEAQKRKLKKVKQLSRERKERLKAKVASQVLALAAASAASSTQASPKLVEQKKIPRLSPSRIRQQKAVAEAKNRVGLSTKYGTLANLVELHRLLLKGNPFSLIEPKQVYPHFHLIPGVNSAIVQPLVRAWQEKATRILYQLLLVEVRGDIARLSKRTALFKADPKAFPDAVLLKIDIGLENEADLRPRSIDQPATPEAGSASVPRVAAVALEDGNQPPSKKSRKFSANFPV